MGFITGYLPSLLGKNFIYATIFAVESFVEKHYQHQIYLLSDKEEYQELTNLIKKLMHDEIDHKKEAYEKLQKFNLAHKIWGKLVGFGSMSAVMISKYL